MNTCPRSIRLGFLSPCDDTFSYRYTVIVRPKSIVTWTRLAVVTVASVTLTGTDAFADIGLMDGQLSLPVIRVVERYPPYAEFCRRHQQECVLTGTVYVRHRPELMSALEAVNVAVNNEIQFMSDINQYNEEDYWALPTSGYGDCEDLALEKRSRLAKAGVASAALRLAFVSHRRLLNSHCILTVETSKGTYVLDSYSNEVSRWDQIPYNFEARERTDGLWDRFDQANWGYDK